MNFAEIFSKTPPANWGIMAFIVVALLALSIYTQRFRKNPIKIIENKNLFLSVSGTICLILFAVILFKFQTKTINYSLEFTGGTMLEVGFPESVDKNRIPDIIKKSVQEYNSSIEKQIAVANNDPKVEQELKDTLLKTPTVQPEGNPRIMDYPNDMNRVDMVLAKKNGSLSKEDVKGLSVDLFNTLGKMRVDEKSISEENGKVKYSFWVETSEKWFTTEEANTEDLAKDKEIKQEEKTENKEDENVENVKRIVVFADQKGFEDILTSFDKDLILDSVNISVPQKLLDENKKEIKDQFNAAFIRLATSKGGNLEDNDRTKLLTIISKNSGNIYIFKRESIGPSIGKELSQKAFTAVLVALILQLIYIAIRFNNKWHYGIVADIGLFHDLVLMFGIYALMNLEFDSPFVSAMMTIIGYSVMNSIVIFDRIRENLKFLVGKSFNEVANASCNQTMTRSVNTTLTVLITLFALYFFGGATLKNFAFALLIGCTAGAYSSIFLVPSLLSVFEVYVKQNEDRDAEKKKEAMKEASEERRRKKIAKRLAEESSEELPPENEDDYIDKPRKAVKEESDEDEEEKPSRRKRIVRRKRR